MRGQKISFYLFFLLIFQTFSSSSQTLQQQTGNPIDACNNVAIEIFINPPVNTTYTGSLFYGNGQFIASISSSYFNVTFPVAGNDGTGHYNIYAIETYSDGSRQQTNTLSVVVAPIALNPISGVANLNCTSPATFSSSFVSTEFVPSASQISSYSWTLPNSSWVINSGNTGGGSNTPTITVTPDAAGTGNMQITAQLTCGYTLTSPILAVTRATPAPTFATTPSPVCNNSTNTFTINPVCGATSYIWTISGSSAATFQANGTQTLTTASTSAAISTGSVNTSDLTVSVQSAFPNGSTSSAATDNFVTGASPAPTIPKIINGETLVGPGPFTYSMATFTSQPITGYKWIVAPEASISGQTTGTVTFTTPKLNSGQSGDVYVTAEYETACGGWSSSPTYYFVDEGSGTGGLPPPPGGLSVQPRAGMSQLAIITNNEDKAKVNTIKAANVYNIMGQLIKKVEFGGANNMEYLDIHDLPSGIYIVQVMTAKGSMTQKIIITR
jgi:hypothetical protein